MLIDIYAFQAVKHVFKNTQWPNLKQASITFWIITAICVLVIIAAQIYDSSQWSKFVKTYAFAMIFVCYLSKIFVVFFLLIDDLWRLLQLVYTYFKPTEASDSVVEGRFQISRSDFLNKLGLMAAAVPFVTLVYGMIKGAYNYAIHSVKLPVVGLPDAFNGFKIVQISDIHSGSFTVKNPLENAIDLILKQRADVIFFTGDLINNRAEELVPYLQVFEKLKAPHGVFSILGNHDYGDYVAWDTLEAKKNNLDTLKAMQKQMGWQLMLDSHTYIEKDGQKIGLLGVENWSTHLRFPKYGSLEKAINGFNPAPFNILLSHDPSHWKAEVLSKYPYINLTLSGHTHGFQFGVEIPGFKWSPVQYVYEQWAGLYNKGAQYLYVNRGFGFLGYPGRVGISPEITVIELQKA